MLLEPLCTPPGHVVVEKTQTLLSSYGVVGRRLVPDDERGVGKQALWREHLQAKKVRRLVGRWKWHSYLRFTSVRNPFDRAVSMFHWRSDAQGIEIPNQFSDCKAAFREFILDNHMKDDVGVTHIGRKFAAQTAIRFETMREDLERLCKERQLPVVPSALPRTKSNTSRPKKRAVSDYFDRETIRTVRTQMAWVFDLYDYPLTPLDCDAAKRMSPQL